MQTTAMLAKLVLLLGACQNALAGDEEMSWEVRPEWGRKTPTTAAPSSSTASQTAGHPSRVPTLPSWVKELRQMVEEWRGTTAHRAQKEAPTATPEVLETSSRETLSKGATSGPTDTEARVTVHGRDPAKSTLLVVGVSALVGLSCATCVAAGLSARALRLLRTAVNRMNQNRGTAMYENVPLSSLTATVRQRPVNAGQAHRRPPPPVSRPISMVNTFSEVDLREDEVAILPAPCEAI